MDNAGGVVLLGILGAAYFLPTIIASHRGHPQTGAIFALDLLLGWTLIGWVVAIVWAVTAFDKRPLAPLAVRSTRAPSGANELEDFARLRDRGVITQEEFEAKKRQILGRT